MTSCRYVFLPFYSPESPVAKDRSLIERTTGHRGRPQDRYRRLSMRKKQVGVIAIKSFALLVVLGTAYQVMAQDAERPYPKMLPLSQYLMDRNAAIALARSAAPEGISKDASVLVLTPKGWETAVWGFRRRRSGFRSDRDRHFRDDGDQSSERSDAGRWILQNVIGIVKLKPDL